MSGSLSSACPVCNGALSTVLPYPRRQAGINSLDFSAIRVCEDCGLGVALPQHPQSALDAFYASGEYWAGAGASARGPSRHASNQCKHRVAHSLHYLSQRARLRVLDVGAGHAWTADWLHALAPGRIAQFDFVEPDLACSAEIQKRVDWYGIRRIERLTSATGPYDLVFLNHVLEHVADPLECMQFIGRIIGNNGIAYVEVPRSDYRFKGDVFPHTLFYTPQALASLGEKTRLRTLLCETFGLLPDQRTGMADRCRSLAMRAGYRAAVALGWASAAQYFDDAIWSYEPADDGIWMRWVVASNAI